MADLYAPKQSPDDYLRGALTRLLGDTRQAADRADKIVSLLDFTPAGIPQAAYSAGQMIGRGAQQPASNAPMGALQMLGGLLYGAMGVAPGAPKGISPEIEQALGRLAPEGITAYHGSPHAFDKFDLSKIGTGEGVQVYGHGLYFAENPEVARGYREKLSAPTGITSQDVAGRVLQATNSREDAIAELQSRVNNLNLRRVTAPETVPAGMMEPGSSSVEQALAFLQAGGNAGGHTYQVRLNANPEHFLDWDKPMSEQHQSVKDALQKMGAAKYITESETTAGQLLNNAARNGYNAADLIKGGGDAVDLGHSGIADALRAAGIPGIKYLDQGSRGAGQGTRNYVVFNPDIIDILKRYAVPVTAGAAVAGNALLGPATNQPITQ